MSISSAIFPVRENRMGLDFKTKFHTNPQLATTCGQEAPIAQYVSRIDAQIAVRFCAMCSIYIMPKARGDISIVSILSEDAFFIRQSCVCRNFAILPRCNVGIYSRADHQVVPSSEQVTNVAILIECAPPPPPPPPPPPTPPRACMDAFNYS